MTIEEITLHNFGPFLGKHCLRLGNVQPNRPVVLVGGLNGAGKTSILEALQLALYGKMSLSARLSSTGYEEYLRNWINRTVRPTDGASVEIVFAALIDGAEQRFAVRRSWFQRGERIVEQTDVWVDGELDRVLSENWADQVDRFIPSRLSQFFFFDGERIEALADPDLSRETLENAVRSLLGLDLVEQLRVDLVALERRRGAVARGNGEADAYAAKEQRCAELDERVRQCAEVAANKRVAMDRAAKHVADAEDELRRAGGELAARKSEIEQERAAVHGAIGAHRGRLLELAGNALPLALLAEDLKGLGQQAQRESDAQKAALLANEIEVRDRDLLLLLLDCAVPKRTVGRAEKHLRADRERRCAATKVEQYLHLSHDSAARLNGPLAVEIARERDLAKTALAELETLERRLEELERSLAAVPDEGALASLLAKKRDAERESTQAQESALRAEMEQKAAEAERDALRAEIAKAALEIEASRLEDADTVRYLRHSERVRETLRAFRDAVLSHHVERLAGLIHECLLELLRKRGLVAGITIDPQDCSLTLFGKDGTPIPPPRLSAGERQLLAVAMLWGLAKASGLSLPVVIDTPLGRLDGTHRRLLVDRYFSAASHQVVLLSTDEEIDARYLERLKPAIASSYTIRHIEEQGTSIIESGYHVLEAASTNVH